MVPLKLNKSVELYDCLTVTSQEIIHLTDFNKLQLETRSKCSIFEIMIQFQLPLNLTS